MIAKGDDRASRTWRLIAALGLAMPVLTMMILAAALSSEDDWIREPLSLSLLATRFTVLLLCVPALIVFIAIVRRSPVLVVTAGGVSLAQSFLAFSGATFGFLLPAVLLLALGIRAGGAEDASPPTRRDLLKGSVVFALVCASWLVVLGTTETRCWSTDVATGCTSGAPSSHGVLGAIALVAIASAVAWRTPGGSPPGR